MSQEIETVIFGKDIARIAWIYAITFGLEITDTMVFANLGPHLMQRLQIDSCGSNASLD
jgi:hypothetical protein